MHIYWIYVVLMVSYSKGTMHPVSPCPSVFSYEDTESEHDRWFGTVLLSTDESLVGVRLDIKLDRPTQILVSWLGEVTTEDNERFTILSLSQKLHPGPALSSRFMVKFNSTQGSPQVRTIRLNGRQICPPDPNFSTDNQNNYQSNFMKNQDATERSTRRPDPDFEDNHQPPTTESTRRTTNRCSSEEHECNPPKRENNKIYQENTVTQSTTERYYDNDEDYPSRPNNQNRNNNNKKHNEKEGRNNNNEQLSTTKRYNNNEDDRLISNNHNQQKTTHTLNYKNENEGSNNNEKFSTTEQYNNVGDDSPGSNNYNQQKTTHKPSYKNVNEGSNNNEQFSTTKRYNYVEDDRQENNNHNQFKTTRKPNVTNDRQSTPKSSPGNKGSTTTHHNNNNQGLKSKLSLGSQELHLSTNYQVNNAQSNTYPGTSTKYKNDSSTMKETNSDNGKTTRLTGIDSSTSKNHNSESDDLETAMTSMKCGSVEVSPAPLITNGQNTARGQWPWHIALYKIDGINLSYSCGGSLISSTAVITAAHCVTIERSGRPVDADTLVVYLGKYHLYQFSDDGGVQNKQVRDVHVYPQYNNTNFHDDIAVLTLTSPVEYTTYVRPVCLWDRDDTDLNAVEGKEGTVVGWGYDENDEVTEELKMAHMPVVSQQTCIWSYPHFFSQFTSNKTFCAGFRKGTSVCNGDSGGGMVFSKESLWYLRGLVSITVARDGRKICDTNHYVVFTDAAKYLDWIRQYIT